MKQFKVSDECICCGACLGTTDLLVENAEGKAVPASRGYISDDFLSKAQEIVSDCPVGAISIIETGVSSAEGKAGLKKLAASLEGKLKGITIPKITANDVKFDVTKYHINTPYPSGECQYVYSSESKAESAALREFDRIAYSQYSRFIVDALVQYKTDKLRPYYILDENSFYGQINKKFEEILTSFANEAESLSNGKIKFSSDFCKFNVYPDADRNGCIGVLSEFETCTFESSIMREYKSDSQYSTRDSYLMYIDTDDMEMYDGQSWFGNDKYVDKYCYENVYEAVKEFVKDLTDAMKYVGIDNKGASLINGALMTYTENVNKAIKKKVNDFKRLVDNI